MAESVEVFVGDGASAGDEREALYTFATVYACGPQRFLLIEEIVGRAPCLMTGCLGTPFAILATHTAAGVDNRAAVDTVAVEMAADAVGDIAKLVEVRPPGQLGRLLPGNEVARKEPLFYFVEIDHYFLRD